jgi:hypothetical protein
MIKLKLKNTAEQIELVKQMGHRDATISFPAKSAFAAFVGDVIQKVLPQASTASMIYTDMNYNEDDSPSFPVELWYDEGANFIQVWYQSVAGGLPTNVVEGTREMKLATYPLTSAVAFDGKYARRARLDVVGKGIERMLQEVILKQERNAWAVICKALAEASTGGANHVIGATTANVLQLDDINRLLTKSRRIMASWAAGTPVGTLGSGITDLFLSPEMKEQIRGFAYQPMNTRSGAVLTSGATAVPLPDGVREEIYRSAGANEIYGIGIVDLLELGISQKYNTLFDNFYGGSPAFATASDEIVFGLDLSREAFIRPIAQNAESGATFIVRPDDQFVSRSDKIGFYGSLEEGRVCIDARAVVGLIV